MNPPPAIKVKNLSKSFKLPYEKAASIKSVAVNFHRHKRGYEVQKALNDISFEIKNGEFFGIVGRNGSGKSTLLKILAGIYAPDNGDIEVNGSLVPFIELGVGFNPELTGRENVYLNGALLGFSRKEMRSMYKDIVEFAELERFMDQKLKNYSSGMQVRLAFSIAIRARGDILLLDEVLAVGDSAFQQKCYDYFSSLKKEKKTIVLVSHNMQIIEKYCDRALLLEKNKIKKIGSSTEVASLYETMFIREEVDRLQKEKQVLSKRSNSKPVTIHSVKIYQSGKASREIKPKKDFEIEIVIEAHNNYDKADVGINIKNRDRLMVISTDIQEINHQSIPLPKSKKTIVIFKIQNVLTDGVYSINVGVGAYDKEMPKMLAREESACYFAIQGIGVHGKSLAHPKIQVKVKQ